MTTYTWEYGSEAQGLHFTITYDSVAQTFSVTSLKGSFDLNALWFSNENTSVDGTVGLTKSDNSLNMNGSTTVWNDDGTSSTSKIVWDEYLKLSNTGLGSAGTDKGTFISEGETETFNFSGFDSNFVFDPATATLGVRATSTSLGGDGIKWADSDSEGSPTDGNETVSIIEDTPVSVAAGDGLLKNATDPDGDPLEITQFTVDGSVYAAGGTATITGVGTLTINADGSYSFTPASNFFGTVPIVEYTVSDGTHTDTSELGNL